MTTNDLSLATKRSAIFSLLNTSFLFFSLLAFLFSVSAQAGEGDHEGKFLKKMAKELSLTAEQQTKLKTIHDSAGGEVKAKREQLKAAHDDLEKALQSAATNDEVRAKFNELQKMQDEFAKARFERILSVRAILTPEQRSKMRGMPEFHGKHGQKGKFGKRRAKDATKGAEEE